MIDYYILIEVSLFVSLKEKTFFGKKGRPLFVQGKVDLVSELYCED